MISAPIKVPDTRPSPPIRLVPPITAAAMAYSSYISPARGEAAFRRAVSSTAAMPAQPPDSA